jgi:hypothetical protein
MALFQASRPVPDGQLTQNVYGLIRDQRFGNAITILERELQVRLRVGGELATVELAETPSGTSR